MPELAAWSMIRLPSTSERRERRKGAFRRIPHCGQVALQESVS
jgi:hypothetical protein